MTLVRFDFFIAFKTIQVDVLPLVVIIVSEKNTCPKMLKSN